MSWTQAPQCNRISPPCGRRTPRAGCIDRLAHGIAGIPCACAWRARGSDGSRFRRIGASRLHGLRIRHCRGSAARAADVADAGRGACARASTAWRPDGLSPRVAALPLAVAEMARGRSHHRLAGRHSPAQHCPGLGRARDDRHDHPDRRHCRGPWGHAGRVPRQRRHSAAGLTAGLFNGLAAMPGPPAVAYYLAAPVQRIAARASLLVFFLATSVSALASAAFIGLIELPARWRSRLSVYLSWSSVRSPARRREPGAATACIARSPSPSSSPSR